MIAISGGGTGGHLIIARVLCVELKKRSIKCVFIGSQKGQDRAWFENSDEFEFKYFLKSSGVVDKKGLNRLFSFINILKLSFECIKIFRRHKIKKLICVGGYSAAPAAFGAIFSRREIYIHEQNAITGRLNRLIKPFCKEFFSSYEGKIYPYPVNDKFYEFARIRTNLSKILFLGGSQGASFINALALNLAPILHKKNIKIIHQCGKNEFCNVREKYIEMGIEADVFDFSNEIEKKMCEADLCIARSGASSLWELVANALPCIFVPFAYAANNHQFFNAKFLLDIDLCYILEQKNASCDEILRIIDNINLAKISASLQNFAKKGGAKIIIDEILS